MSEAKSANMEIFVGIPMDVTDAKERKAVKEEIVSRYGADFGHYNVMRQDRYFVTYLKQLAKCDAAMFAKGFEKDEMCKSLYDVCTVFGIPVYK